MISIRVVRINGSEELHQAERGRELDEVRRLIGADALDSFSLRNGKRVWVNDAGHPRGLPVNPKATAMYHSICVPGTTMPIRGDVAILREEAENVE